MNSGGRRVAVGWPRSIHNLTTQRAMHYTLREVKVPVMEPTVRTPVTIALVNDYDIVVMGIAHILDQYQDRVVIAELDTNVAVSAWSTSSDTTVSASQNPTMTRSAC